MFYFPSTDVVACDGGRVRGERRGGLAAGTRARP